MDNDPDTKWMDNSFTNSVFFETPQVRSIPRELTPVMQRLRIVRMQISTDHHELSLTHGQRRRGARPLQVEAEPQCRLQQQLGRGGRPQCQRPDRGALQPPGLVPDIYCRRCGKCSCLAPRSSFCNPDLQAFGVQIIRSQVSLMSSRQAAPTQAPRGICFRLTVAATRGSDPYCPRCTQIADLQLYAGTTALTLTGAFQTNGESTMRTSCRGGGGSCRIPKTTHEKALRAEC
jgi:hypothetical protein